MDANALIDPESRPPLLARLTELGPAYAALPLHERRALAAAIDANQPMAESDQFSITTMTVDAAHGRLPLRLYTPRTAPDSDATILYIHGGGMVMGSAATDDPIAGRLCAELSLSVVSVDYRLAPEHPYPAAVEDCLAAFDWLCARQAAAGTKAPRLGIVGGSAGGGLALATALLARDRNRHRADFVMAMYPMIDDRGETDSSRQIVDVGAWDRGPNQEAWAWYLGGRPADQYASPARAKDLGGLPPTFIDVGTLDLFRDEDVAFAQRLMQAGVPTELHVYPGAYHASEHLAPDAPLSRKIWSTRLEAIRTALISPVRSASGDVQASR